MVTPVPSREYSDYRKLLRGESTPVVDPKTLLNSTSVIVLLLHQSHPLPAGPRGSIPVAPAQVMLRGLDKLSLV